jgi:hypothetical protein
VSGIQGVLNAYNKTLMQILFSGPTLFAPCLEAFKKHCEREYGQPSYNVLLILTDGEIHDMPQTKALLVDLSHFACSVIIVGVGDEDFSNMRMLDSDHSAKLSDDLGRPCVRDIVQFVEFKKAVQAGCLSEEVLREVPKQFMSFVQMHNIPVNYSAQDMSKYQV